MQSSHLDIRKLSDRIDTSMHYYLARFAYTLSVKVIGDRYLACISILVLGICKVLLLSRTQHNAIDKTAEGRIGYILYDIVILCTAVLAQLVANMLLQTCGIQADDTGDISMLHAIGAFVALSGLLTVITVLPANILENEQLSKCIRLVLFAYADTMQSLFETSTYKFIHPVVALIIVVVTLHLLKGVSDRFFDHHFSYVLQAMGMMKCNLLVAWLLHNRRPDIALGYVLVVIYFADLFNTLLKESDGVRDYLVFVASGKIRSIVLPAVFLYPWMWCVGVLFLVIFNSLYTNTLFTELLLLIVANQVSASLTNSVELVYMVDALISLFLYISLIKITKFVIVLF